MRIPGIATFEIANWPQDCKSLSTTFHQVRSVLLEAAIETIDAANTTAASHGRNWHAAFRERALHSAGASTDASTTP